MEEKGLTVADALALRGNNANTGNSNGFDNFGGGAWWVIILILFFAIGGRGFGGYGYGGEGGGGVNTLVVPQTNSGWGNNWSPCCTPATQQGLTSAFNFNQLDNGIRSLERGLCDGFYTTNLAITNLGTNVQAGFNNVDRTNLQGFNAIQSEIAQTNYNLKDCCCQNKELVMQSNFNMQSGINAIQNQLSSCCCELGRGQKDIEFALAKATCDITTNADKNADRILSHLTQTEMDRLRTDLQSAQYQLSQLSQTRTIIDQLQPFPRPAYITCSPYAAVNTSTTNAYGCGCM